LDLGINGRAALVTAASRGLGRASALALAADGCNVAICGRTAATLAGTEAELSALGVDVLALEMDVGEPRAAEALVAATVERFGRLDILIGNTGGPATGPALSLSEEELRDALDVHVLRMTALVRAAVPHMQSRRWGRICLITATGVREPLPGHALSATARTALWAWAKAASHALIADGITINTLCPGAHDTDRMKEIDFPGPRGDPSDFGKLAAMLCSQPAGFLTGAAVNVDGGSTLALL
jgi:3-oxoacyl-[acyl-carrier protein] reductase